MSQELQKMKIMIEGVEVEVNVLPNEQPSCPEAKCTVVHMRNGEVINTITPYSDAGIFDKVLYHLGMRNYTR